MDLANCNLESPSIAVARAGFSSVRGEMGLRNAQTQIQRFSEPLRAHRACHRSGHLLSKLSVLLTLLAFSAVADRTFSCAHVPSPVLVHGTYKVHTRYISRYMVHTNESPSSLGERSNARKTIRVAWGQVLEWATKASLLSFRESFGSSAPPSSRKN
jgi:hypothetical protein